jgi:hypothetical protein
MNTIRDREEVKKRVAVILSENRGEVYSWNFMDVAERILQEIEKEVSK